MICAVQAEVFSFEGADGSEHHWLVSLILFAIATGRLRPECVRLAITDDLYETVLRCNGVEEARLPAISEERLRYPVIVVAMPDECHVLIDGSHRLVESYRHG